MLYASAVNIRWGNGLSPVRRQAIIWPVLKLYARYISECTGLASEIMITPTSHGCYAVTSHWPIGCLFKDLIWLTPKTPSKPCITGRFCGNLNSPMTGGFPSPRTSNPESVSTQWRHQKKCEPTGRSLLFVLFCLYQNSIVGSCVLPMFTYP